jgi:zinc transporter ZupT
MRVRERSLHFVVNFLLGVAWATAFIGAVSTFLSYYPTNPFLFSLLFALLAMIPGFIFVLCIEHFITAKERSYALEEQTRLLKELLQKAS